MTDKATVPFVATDSNGVVVHGYVEVHRPGPGGRYYGNPRAADAYFEFLETREICLIDPYELKRAMAQALTEPLETIGIANPSQAAVDRDVEEKYDGIQAQCGAELEYVSTPRNVTLANLNEDDLQFS
jgi:hypothetical protein